MGIGSDILDEFKENLIEEVSNEFGGGTHNNLKNFLDGISNAHNESIAIKQPDPLNSFDVRFKFFPSIAASANGKSNSIGSKLVNSLTSAAKNTVRSQLNKLTNGLVGSFMNDVDVISEHDKFTAIRSESESHSFIEYLAKANLLCGSESNWIGGMGDITSPLEIDMTFFILKITIPHLKINMELDDVDYFGKFPINGKFVEPDNHTLTMSVMNTKVPVLERIFYPWMREVTLPYWSYSTLPYTTATITVDLTSHSDIKYVFIGCRPCDIEAFNPDQALPAGMERLVQFAFDYMFVTSDLHTTDESFMDKLVGMATSFIKL